MAYLDWAWCLFFRNACEVCYNFSFFQIISFRVCVYLAMYRWINSEQDSSRTFDGLGEVGFAHVPHSFA